MISKRLSKMQDFLWNCKFVIFELLSDSNDVSIVKLGDCVEFEIDWEVMSFVIWWFDTPIKWRLAYNSPLWRVLIGRGVGESFYASIWNNKKLLKIIDNKKFIF
jgi:hypothetical protein